MSGGLGPRCYFLVVLLYVLNGFSKEGGIWILNPQRFSKSVHMIILAYKSKYYAGNHWWGYLILFVIINRPYFLWHEMVRLLIKFKIQMQCKQFNPTEGRLCLFWDRISSFMKIIFLKSTENCMWRSLWLKLG